MYIGKVLITSYRCLELDFSAVLRWVSLVFVLTLVGAMTNLRIFRRYKPNRPVEEGFLELTFDAWDKEIPGKLLSN